MLTVNDFITFNDSLNQILSDVDTTQSLNGLSKRFGETFELLGIKVDRIQLPLSYISGFRHPFYAGIVLTWYRQTPFQEERQDILYMEKRVQFQTETLKRLKDSPYSPLLFENQESIFYSSSHEIWSQSEFFKGVRAKNIQSYCAFRVPLADGSYQVVSLSSQEEWSADLEQTFLSLRTCLAPFFYAAYKNTMATQIATTYLGEKTGQRVLKGDMGRGTLNPFESVIIFADIRDFTTLSEKLGALKMIQLVNQAFEIIDDSVSAIGGEILKFIGDAALVIFPRKRLIPSCSESDLSIPDLPSHLVQKEELKEENQVSYLQILRTLKEILTLVQEVGKDEDLSFSMGMGVHLGEVMYGNIGSKQRLDFTVMGPAVNLTARLESATKSLGVDLVISAEYAHALLEENPDSTDLHLLEEIRVKGIKDPIQVWTFESN